MIDKLKRSREPLSWLAIGLVVLGIGLTTWRLIGNFAKMSAFAAFQDAGGSWLDGTLALAVVVLVLSCSVAAPPVSRARLLTQLAAIVLSLGVGLTLVSNLIGMWASAGGVGVAFDFLGGLPILAFKAVLAGVAWVLLRALRAGRIEPAVEETKPEAADGLVAGAAEDAAEAAAEGAVEGADEAAAEDAAAAAEDTEVVERDPDAGAVWWSAADAAAGAPARDRMPEDGAPSKE
jgi:hypothetical protein